MSDEYPIVPDYPLQVGDKVCHIKDGSLGTIVQIDWNLIHMGYPVTTCRVKWDDDITGDPDIQWTNKLERLEGGM